jgi:hypothetical protein
MDAEELRGFLALCIDPGPHRHKRSPVRLTHTLPPAYADAVQRLAPPIVRRLAEVTADLTTRAEEARTSYATALLAWIRGEDIAGNDLHALVEETTAHGRDCPRCTVDGLLSPACPTGHRLTATLLGTDQP